MTDITPIVNAVIALAAAVVTAFVIPWIKSKTTAAQREEIEAWVRIAVTAAEQIYKGSGRGEEKKEYVLEFLRQAYLYIIFKKGNLFYGQWNEYGRSRIARQSQ